MRAVVFHGKEDVAIAEVPDPRIVAPTDALIEVRMAGVCGSDLHPYHEREKGLDRGAVMGHEAVGVVLEVGSAVARLTRGDRVALPFSTSCGACYFCAAGLTCRCASGQLFGWTQSGRGLAGLQAEYARVPLAESTAVRLPEDVSDEEGLLLGDVFSTGWYCADLAECKPGGVYAVIGCGPVGIMAIHAARARGVTQVFAIDRVPERLALAARAGGVALDARTTDAIGAVKEATEGRGADGVLEAVGARETERLAYDLVRPGGIVAVAGVHTSATFSFSPAEAYDKNLTFRVGRCPARRLMAELLPRLRERSLDAPRWDVTDVISHRFELARAPEAYRLFDEKRDGCTKVVLRPRSGA